jgi:PAS domain S-box-containing protein
MTIARARMSRKSSPASIHAFVARYGDLFDFLNDAVAVCGLNGDIVAANQAMGTLTGYGVQELHGMNVSRLVCADGFREIMERQGQQVRGEAVSQRYEMVWNRKDGTKVIGESVTRLISEEGEPVGVLAIVKNITEQKRAQEALRYERDRAQRYLDVAGVAIQVIDPDQKTALINRKFREMLGYEEHEVIGRNWFEIFTPERNRGLAKALFAKLVAGKIALDKCHESPVLARSGEERIIAWYNTTLLRDDAGAVIGVLGSGEDVTERRLMEKALVESEERYRSLFQNSRDAICIVSRDLEVIDVNRAALDLFGYAREEMRELDIQASSVYPAEGREFRRQMEEEGYVRDYEMTLRRKDGTHINCLLTFTARRDSAGSILRYEGIIRDVTEQKRLQQNLWLYVRQITRAQEEERKRIARELHDETVQALATLLLDIEAISRARKPLPRGVIEGMEQVRGKVTRIAEELSRLSRALRPSVLDQLGLVAAVELILGDLSRTGRISGRLEVTGQQRRLPAEVELGLFRITQEAVSNARKHSSASTVSVTVGFLPDGVSVAISDDGKGFELPGSLSDLAAMGKLGLVGMQERAQLLDGEFRVQSAPGKGTLVRVSLKAAVQTGMPAPA